MSNNDIGDKKIINEIIVIFDKCEGDITNMNLSSLPFNKVESIVVEFEKERIARHFFGEINNVSYDIIELLGANYYKEHVHDYSNADFYFLKGDSSIISNGNKLHFNHHEKVHISAGTSHGFNVKEKTYFLSVQSPPIYNSEKDQYDIRLI